MRPGLQNNLRNMGQALMQYAQANNDQLPKVPASGNLAAAGVYAPMLVDAGHEQVREWIVCPASDLADECDCVKMPSLSGVAVKCST